MFNFSNKNNNSEESEENYNEMMKWLREIGNQTFNTAERVKALEEFCQAMSPSDNDSIQQRKRENLIKIYSRHLIKKEKLSPKDALVRARFEVLKFDNDEIIDDMNREIKNQEEEIAEKEYYTSEVVEKDIKDFWTTGNIKTDERWINHYDLFAPIYNLMKGSYHDFKEGDKISVDWDTDKNYYSFIKNRAIIRNLEKLGIISKITDNERPRDLGNQNYKLNIVDLNKIGEIIYKGPREGHDDSFFDERLREGSLERIFRIE